MKKRLAFLVPGLLKPFLRTLYYLPIDFAHRFRGWLRGRDSMIPPPSMIFVGDEDFETVGQEFKGYFVELAHLRPDARVLDAGCGIGRMAVPLTGYLTRDGEYWGFDAVEKGIVWCREHISSKFSHFHFRHVDVYNRHYNPTGTVLARDFTFPLETGHFDFVFLTSVFTHMVPVDMEHYLGEISRVLKPGGRCLITFFLLNGESKALISSGRSTLDFTFELGPCLTVDENDPEAAIAYDEEYVEALYDKHGLDIVPPTHYGAWCERDDYLSYQDLIIAEKRLTGRSVPSAGISLARASDRTSSLPDK